MEAIVKKATMKFLEQNHLLSDLQHGFRQNRSCLSSLLLSTEQWTRALDEDGRVDFIYTDFKKAFDNVPHKRLIYKLSEIGIRGRLLTWMTDFLTGRSQTVCVEASRSAPTPVLSGVPQGSVLGPLLFLIYINDCIDDLGCSAIMFADDVKLWRAIRSDADRYALQDSLNRLNSWSARWLLNFNGVVLRLLTKKTSKEDDSFQYVLGGQPLSNVVEQKDLGVLMTSSLKPSSQCQKAAKRLTPTEFTATALNSSAIRVTWKKPRRSGELSGKYELIVYSSTREVELYIRATEDIIGDVEPSTTYNLTVRAFWSNDTPVDAVAFTSVTTRPRRLVPTEFTATALNSSAIRVTWEKPRRSGELSGKYELIVDSSTREDQLYIHATEDIIGGFEPSTTYNLTVRAFWSNDTPVDAVAFTTVTTRPREGRTVPVYKLCKKEHEECEFVPYREKDTTKGKGCRDACAKQRGGLNETMTVYFCEEPSETCTPYEVYGRAGYAENFERHFKCVSLCHLVGRVQHSVYNDFEMCSSDLEPCVKIQKINGTFDAFNKCAFRCDGWPDLEKPRRTWHYSALTKDTSDELPQQLHISVSVYGKAWLCEDLPRFIWFAWNF
ncbi:hypothetical protein SprV_0602227100 [Sparganum proliferum]